jgi:tRNA(Ile2)-agmatinylcytidine synthase
LPSSSTFHIGFDDTDSTDGMCTTFLCYNLAKRLSSSKGTRFLDYPNLIRLNPNIPWKTRGNAALAIRIRTDLSEKQLLDICKQFIEKFATSPRANAGLIISKGDAIPKELWDFSRRALDSVLTLREARELIEELGLVSYSLRLGQGLIGALAAVGNVLPGDHTYELIAYRKDLSLPRAIDKQRVILMNNSTFPNTFGSYDPNYDRVMITPHGPDPVLCGIRGESAQAVTHALQLLGPLENLRGWMIFRSNQGTGEHLRQQLNLDNVKSFVSGRATGVVTSAPIIRRGGHVFFTIGNSEGRMECACYEPTAIFRNAVLSLALGDVIEVGGGVRRPTQIHPKVLNLEYLKPLKLEKKLTLKNPKCPDCLVSMESMGWRQGHRCRKCGFKIFGSRKLEMEEPRAISTRTIYIPPTKAHRHLTKPLHRTEGGKRASIPIKLSRTWFS